MCPHHTYTVADLCSERLKEVQSPKRILTITYLFVDPFQFALLRDSCYSSECAHRTSSWLKLTLLAVLQDHHPCPAVARKTLLLNYQ